MDLTTFLLERIAEDEAAAQAATPGPWDADGGEAVLWAAGEDRGEGIAHASWEIDDATAANFTHIARHDPARVLAQCAALRAVVELHAELYWFSGARGLEATGKCRMCAENEDSDYDGAPLVEWPCPTLRALASIWAGHEAYGVCLSGD